MLEFVSLPDGAEFILRVFDAYLRTDKTDPDRAKLLKILSTELETYSPGLLRPGEILRIRRQEETEAELQNDGSVKFGVRVTKFSAIQICSAMRRTKRRSR
jgi:hypothetical protein